MMAGYSGTPLLKKLGYKDNFIYRWINAPDHYAEILGPLPPGAEHEENPHIEKDLIHIFCFQQVELITTLPGIQNELVSNGMVWVSWPKKASKVPTDLDGNFVRTFGISNGLVDIKVCAVDEIWSGLKFVIPVKDRK